MSSNLPEPAGSAADAPAAPVTPEPATPETGPRSEPAAPSAEGPGSEGDGAPASTPGAPASTSGAPEVDPAEKARARRLVIVGVAAVLLVAVAVLLAVLNYSARHNGPLANQAFVDSDSTSAVVGDVTSAIKVVYSYDYKTLDANQAAAKAVITGKFSQDFDKVFAGVKQLAPQQQAVLTTTVPAVGVVALQGDRAQLLMMVDQNGTRMGSQPIAGTSARLVVQAQLVDGHWKIAEVTPE